MDVAEGDGVELEFVPPPPQDRSIAQAKVMKCFISYSQKKLIKILQEKSLPKKAFFRLSCFNLQ
tara:strand:+ start:2770 stop:2961 length:192 start_codon:yes stop_codon:yes gene_type:complete